MKLKMIRLKKLSFMTVAAVAAVVMVVAAGSMFVAPKASAALSTNARNLAGLIAVDDVTGGGSFTSTNNINDLIVLQGLFGTGTQAQKTQDLTGLIAVDSVLNDGGAFGGSGGSLTDDTSLGDLIVLSSLFPVGTTADARNFAGLIAVSNMAGDSGTNGAFTKGSSNLGDLLVLNNLFLDP